MKEKRKLLLKEHVNVGLLASEIFILVESKPTLLCLHWGHWVVNLSTNQMQAKIKWLGHARCPRFRQFACFYFKFSFQEVLSNNAIHLPRSVRSSHWSKASIVWTKKWMKSKGQLQLLMREQKRWGKSGKKSNRRGQKLYSKYTMCMYLSEVKLRSNGSNIRKNVW